MRSAPTNDPAIFPPGDGPDEIEDGLWRIPLPLPFALRSVNVYLAADGAGGWTLFDAGLGLPADEAALRAGLAAAGAVAGEHRGACPDACAPRSYRVGGHGRRRFRLPRLHVPARSRADVSRLEQVRRGDRGSGDPSAPGDVSRAWPPGRCARHRRAIHAEDATDTPIIARAFHRRDRDGETLTLGGRRHTAIWTPGHSDYHLCLLRDDDVFFVGDHILPTITPNIGVYPDARPDPLRDYFESLARVRTAQARLVLPGHGHQFTDVMTRVDELRAHHEERSATLMEKLAAYPAGAQAWELASALFAGRLRTSDDQRFALRGDGGASGVLMWRRPREPAATERRHQLHSRYKTINS